MTAKKQNIKKMTAICLVSMTMLSSSHATDTLLFSNLSEREKILRLIGLNEFDKSFDLEGDLFKQMESRKNIWKNPRWKKQSHQEKIEELIKDPFQGSEIINYIPFYLK